MTSKEASESLMENYKEWEKGEMKMKKYKEWKSETGEIVVEVFNEQDLPDVQRIYIDRGYYIIWTKYTFNHDYFFAIFSADGKN